MLVSLPASAQSNKKPVEKPKPKPTLIVFDIINERGVDKSMANLITELILDQVSRYGKYTVIGQKDLDKMLSWEQSKQLRGCNDTQCLVQIAGALGAEYYIEGSIGVMGDLYLVSLKYIDAINVKVLERSTEKVKKDENVVMSTVERQVEALLSVALAGNVKDLAGGKGGVQLKPMEKWGIGLTASGAGVAVIGGIMTLMASKSADEMRNATDPKEITDAAHKVDAYNAAAVTMYTVGGAAVVTGVVLWVLGATEKPRIKSVGLAGVATAKAKRSLPLPGDHNPPLTFSSFTPLIAPGFGGLSFGGEW